MTILADQATNIHPDFADVAEKFALTGRDEILLMEEGTVGYSTVDVEIIPLSHRSIEAYRANIGGQMWRSSIYNADGSPLSDEDWANCYLDDEMSEIPFHRRNAIRNTRHAVAPTKSGRFLVSNGMWLVGPETADGIEVTSWSSYYERHRAEEKRQGVEFLAAHPEFSALRPAWAENTDVYALSGWVNWSTIIGKVSIGLLVTLDDDGLHVGEPIIRVDDAEDLTAEDAAKLAHDLSTAAGILATEVSA